MTRYKGDYSTRVKKAKIDEEALSWLNMMEQPEEIWVKYYENELKKKQKDLEDSLNTADFYSKRWNYNSVIVEIGKNILASLDLPANFSATITQTRKGQNCKVFGQTITGNYTKDGILVALRAGGKHFYNAFWTIGIPDVDIGALKHVFLRMENTVDALTGKLEGHTWDKTTPLSL
jgi:hypothetical protein